MTLHVHSQIYRPTPQIATLEVVAPGVLGSSISGTSVFEALQA